MGLEKNYQNWQAVLLLQQCQLLTIYKHLKRKKLEKKKYRITEVNPTFWNEFSIFDYVCHKVGKYIKQTSQFSPKVTLSFFSLRVLDFKSKKLLLQ